MPVWRAGDGGDDPDVRLTPAGGDGAAGEYQRPGAADPPFGIYVALVTPDVPAALARAVSAEADVLAVWLHEAAAELPHSGRDTARDERRTQLALELG
jgi:hypothetical protein